MEKKLQKQFNSLENQRIQLIQQLSKYNNAELNKSPAADKWAVNQIICHLVLAEELSYKSIKSKIITSTDFEKSGIMSGIRTLLLTLFLRSSKKFKAPTAVSKMPDQSALSDLIKQWDEVRKLLQELLESLPESLLNKYIFKHPVAGKMNIYGGLSFMQEHVRRHSQQIENILAKR